MTIHAHGSPYALNVEGRGPWTVFYDVASCMLFLLSVMFCYVMCLVIFIYLYYPTLTIISDLYEIIKDSP